MDVGGDIDWFGENGDSVGELCGGVGVGLWYDSFALWTDGGVNRWSDDGFIAVWRYEYTLDLKSEKKCLECEMILFM
jgi:hypothetical protein